MFKFNCLSKIESVFFITWHFLCVLEEATGGMRRELTIYYNGPCWTRSDVREKRVATSFSESNLEKDTLKQNRTL